MVSLTILSERETTESVYQTFDTLIRPGGMQRDRMMMKTGNYKGATLKGWEKRKMGSFGPCISKRLEMLLDKLS
jgi:hypothetical protein